MTEKIAKNEDELRKERKRLDERLAMIKQKKDRLIELYTDGTIIRREFDEKMKEYRKMEVEIMENLATLNAKLHQASIKPKIIERIKCFCEIMKNKISNLTQEQKQKFLRFIVEKIEKIILDSNKREAKIIGHIPLENKKEPLIKAQSRILSIPSWNHGQYPSKRLKFKLEIKV